MLLACCGGKKPVAWIMRKRGLMPTLDGRVNVMVCRLLAGRMCNACDEGDWREDCVGNAGTLMRWRHWLYVRCCIWSQYSKAWLGSIYLVSIDGGRDESLAALFSRKVRWRVRASSTSGVNLRQSLNVFSNSAVAVFPSLYHQE